MRDDTLIPVIGQRAGSAAGPLGAATNGKPIPQAPPRDRVRSLYVHVPFCFHKCHYCDFYSIVDTRDRQGAFAERLCRELRAFSPWAGKLETVFVGGGTPSLLRVALWQELLRVLGAEFDFSGAPEFTVECNPETVTPELLDVLKAGGVNRVSMGAQSFESRHLKTLERWHSPENVARALEIARGAGIGRLNVDLIFGIPGQTVAEWESDLRTALDLGTTHLSCYNLTYEPNTAMTARMKRGEFSPADEDTEVEMYEATLRLLRAKGLDRYEISNYSTPGQECRHNLVYWRGGGWLAAGPSASGHVAGHRWKNVARLDDYLAFDDRGFAPIVDWERPDPRRAFQERIMTGLRLREGLSVEWTLSEAQRIGDDPLRLQRAVQEACGRGHATIEGDRLILTDAGMLFADGLAAGLMGIP